MAPVIVLMALALMILLFIFYKKPRKKLTLPAELRDVLHRNVSYYQRLSPPNKFRFEEMVGQFLNYVRIDGVDTTVEDLDRALVAASAIIPVFGFTAWKYNNVRNVLLYPGSFNQNEFLASGYEKNTLGMVGSGAMQQVMILSRSALRNGFMEADSRSNTGIHEFVHLLDKEDGEVDGLPEALIGRKDNAKWSRLVDENIEMILARRSDLDSYAASNKAEFFAVAAEYFFNQPRDFKDNHPELYELMSLIFQQDPLEPDPL